MFDPHGDLLPDRCRGWHFHDGVARQWRPDEEDRYHVAKLGVSLQIADGLLRVLDLDGRAVPFGFEPEYRLREMHETIAAQERDVAPMQAELASLRAQLENG